MEKIKILHIGDIHYPENRNKHEADEKDSGISDEFVKKISPNCFKNVSDQLIRKIKTEEIDAILFSGDLTSRGDLEGYKLCVDYINQILNKDNIGRDIEIHVVPGNHDLNRKDKENKFLGFSDYWKNSGRDILKPNEVRNSSIQKSISKINISSLNTCIGCGEFRGFPEKIIEKISSIVDASDINLKENFDIFGENLDTPAAHQDDISKIESIIFECKQENSIPVILGHHGLLPQALIRTEIYTEMINSGYIRTMLNSMEYPVIYCHGHIHDDPVEVIVQPQYNESILVNISAPAFVDGFNIIEFDFSKNGFPLGCIIKTFKMKTYAGVKQEREIRVPLKKPGPLDKYKDSKLEKINNLIPSEPTFYRDLNIEDADPENLKNILLELEWLGTISVDNRDQPEKKWIIRKVGI